MKVTLVDSMGSIKRVADIASICYGKEEAKYPERLFRKLIDLGHTSVLEHYVFTFKIEEISRACLAQLVRHRHASYTVESQRYVKYDLMIDYVYPKGLTDAEKRKYDLIIEQAWENYNSLLDMGVRAEDARLSLPIGVTTNLYMTINLRSLLNLFKLRMDKAAQWEIRELAFTMFNTLDKDLRDILKDYLPVSNKH